jgi:hypothetical protein
MGAPETSPNSVARQQAKVPRVELPAALECYLSSILEIAETIEAISPEVGPAYRELLMALQSRLSADTTAEALEESRVALHRNPARILSESSSSEPGAGARPEPNAQHGDANRRHQRGPQRPVRRAADGFRGPP